MGQGKPITDDVRDAILQEIRDGGTCRGIAKAHEVSTDTVRRIASKAGITDAFARASTKKATEARQADNRAKRAELATESLEAARVMMQRGLKPKNGHDAQGWAIAFGIYADKHLALEKADVASSADGAKSMLGDLFATVKQAWEEESAGQPPVEPQTGRVGGDE